MATQLETIAARPFAEVIATPIHSLLRITAQGIYFTDGGSPNSMHELMGHIRDNWGGQATLRCYSPDEEGASRPFRIAVRAYAAAYGIKMRDAHEQYGHLKLTKRERKQMRWLTSQIVNHHKDVSVLHRLVWGWKFWASWGFVLALLYVAVGTELPLLGLKNLIAWVGVWDHFRILCGLAVIVILFVKLNQYFSEGGSVQQFAPAPPPMPTNTTYAPRKVGGIYGAAGAAADYEIDGALNGFADSMAPIFAE